MNDLRYAVRQLLKSPGFTVVAVLTLALGIGVNTAMFSGLHSLLMPELPYPESERLIRIFRTSPYSQRWPHSPAAFLDLREQRDVFSHLAATTSRRVNLSEPGEPPERLRAERATADFLPMLGLAPQLGRGFRPDEDQPGRDQVAILSHAFWVRRFNADPAVLGRVLRLDGEPVTVIGVLPPEFADRQTWGRADVLRPMAFSSAERENRGNNYLDVFARLQPGVTDVQATAAVTTMLARARADGSDASEDTGYRVVPLARSRMDPRGQLMLWMILGLAGFVLLIACANLANLQFARTAYRSRELAIRCSLGAGRGRLLRQLLTENLLLAALGGLVGLLFARWTTQWLTYRLVEDGVPMVHSELNLAALGFAFVASSVSGVAFGLLPAWWASRVDPNAALRHGDAGGGTGPARQRLRHALIVIQIALALMLLSGAGLVGAGLRQFSRSDLGWRLEGLHAGQLNLPEATYPDAGARRRFVDLLQQKLSTVPGVERAAVASALPISGSRSHIGLAIEAPATRVDSTLSALAFVSPGYFSTLGVRLVEGREFESGDSAEGPAVILINESFARACWPTGSAVGKRIGQPGAWHEIVGVIADIRSATDPSEPTTRFQCFRPLAQDPQSGLAIVVRGPVSVDALRRAVADLDPDLPLSEAGSVRATVGHFFDQASVAGGLLAGFAGLGLLLSSLGTYSVVATYVGQRTREIGVRMALGAEIWDVLWLVLGRGLRLTLTGTALGLLGSVGLGRILSSLLPGLAGNQPAILIAASGVLFVVAAIACWLPARTASHVDPMVALRGG